MGARSYKVDGPNQLPGALADALREREPAVIEALVDIEAVPPMALRIQTLDKFFEKPEPDADRSIVAAAAPVTSQ